MGGWAGLRRGARTEEFKEQLRCSHAVSLNRFKRKALPFLRPPLLPADCPPDRANMNDSTSPFAAHPRAIKTEPGQLLSVEEFYEISFLNTVSLVFPNREHPHLRGASSEAETVKTLVGGTREADAGALQDRAGGDGRGGAAGSGEWPGGAIAGPSPRPVLLPGLHTPRQLRARVPPRALSAAGQAPLPPRVAHHDC